METSTPNPSPERVQAIAVGDGRVLAIGTNDEVRKMKGSRTQVIDLAGHFVMPGFNDAHLHLASGGFSQLSVDLRGTKTLQEMQDRIGSRAKQAAAGEWIQGSGWDHTLWPGQTLPTRQDLDAVHEWASGDISCGSMDTSPSPTAQP